MAKKLYRVELFFAVFVLADSEQDAEREAAAAFRLYPDECGDPDSIATELRTLTSIPPDWLDALPFGADDGDERTIKQVLEARRAQEAS